MITLDLSILKTKKEWSLFDFLHDCIQEDLEIMFEYANLSSYFEENQDFNASKGMKFKFTEREYTRNQRIALWNELYDEFLCSTINFTPYKYKSPDEAYSRLCEIESYVTCQGEVLQYLLENELRL